MTTILIVDDSAVARKMAGGCVEENGLQPIYAGNGQEALECIERDNPDIVLTDLQMPGMSGLELVEQIRELRPGIPVMLMTAYGSEDTAVAALKAGASSYVPKHNLRQDLADALRIVLAAIDAKAHREKVRRFLLTSESSFSVGYEPEATVALVSHLQDALSLINFCDDTGLFQVSTALTEALTNAIEHGNLELDSKLREEEFDSYNHARRERVEQPPYSERRVHVRAKLTPDEVTYVISDEGPGFDPSGLPDPLDPENLLRASGRGLTLIQTFMDDVSFNDRGNEIRLIKRREDRR